MEQNNSVPGEGGETPFTAYPKFPSLPSYCYTEGVVLYH